MFKIILQHATSALLIVVAARQIYQVTRNWHDTALRALTIGVVSIAIAATVNISDSPLYPVVKDALGKAYGPLIDALWISIPCALAAFFTLARHDKPTDEKKRVVRAIAAIFVLYFALWMILPYVAPTAVHHAPGHSIYQEWERILSVVVSIVVIEGVWAFVLLQGYRYLRELSNTWLRWAVRLVLLGSVGMSTVGLAALAKNLLRAYEGATTPKRYPVTSAIYITGLLGGQALLAVGLVLPTVAAVVTGVARLRDRYARDRRSRSLEPLWDAVTTAFPYIVLHQASSLRQFERRVGEISDGLAQLGPYYVAHGVTEEHEESGVHDPRTAAQIICDSLDAHRLGAPRGVPPYPRFEPDFSDWRKRSQWMVKVGHELRKLQAQRVGDADPATLGRLG